MTWRGLLASWAAAFAVWLICQTGPSPAEPWILVLLLAAAPLAWLAAGKLMGDTDG